MQRKKITSPPNEWHNIPFFPEKTKRSGQFYFFISGSSKSWPTFIINFFCNVQQTVENKVFWQEPGGSLISVSSRSVISYIVYFNHWTGAWHHIPKLNSLKVFSLFCLKIAGNGRILGLKCFFVVVAVNYKRQHYLLYLFFFFIQIFFVIGDKRTSLTIMDLFWF